MGLFGSKETGSFRTNKVKLISLVRLQGKDLIKFTV